MSVYFIAQIKIKDSKEYEKYIKGIDKVFSKYKGEYLIMDDNPIILEGEWDYSRIVIIKFLHEKELRKWYESEEYQDLVQYRLKAAKSDTLIVKILSRN